jgi:hypothetical protein
MGETISAVLAGAILCYMYDKLEGHLKAIADATVGMQVEMQALRADMARLTGDSKLG